MTIDQLYKDFVSAYDAWRDKPATGTLSAVDKARDAIRDAELALDDASIPTNMHYCVRFTAYSRFIESSPVQEIFVRANCVEDAKTEAYKRLREYTITILSVHFDPIWTAYYSKPENAVPPQLVPANIESFLAGMNHRCGASLRSAGGGANE